VPWVKFDDGFVQNPKVARLSDLAFRLYHHGLFHSAQNLTDGRVDGDLLDIILPRATRPGRTRAVQELVSAGLWRSGGDCYLINDYHEYQPTKAEVEAQRERWRNWKAKQRASKDDSPVDSTPESTEDKQQTPVESLTATVSDTVSDTVPSAAADAAFREFNKTRARQVAVDRGADDVDAYAVSIEATEDFVEKSVRLWLLQEEHRDCEKCGGTGWGYVYPQAGGRTRVECDAV